MDESFGLCFCCGCESNRVLHSSPISEYDFYHCKDGCIQELNCGCKINMNDVESRYYIYDIRDPVIWCPNHNTLTEIKLGGYDRFNPLEISMTSIEDGLYELCNEGMMYGVAYKVIPFERGNVPGERFDELRQENIDLYIININRTKCMCSYNGKYKKYDIDIETSHELDPIIDEFSL